MNSFARVPNIFAKDFRFEEDKYPLGSWTSVIGAVVAYLVIIFGLRKWMEDRKRYELSLVVTVHNFFLSALSLTMLVGLLYNVANIYLTTSNATECLLCDPKGELAIGPQVGWFYIFFLSKYYELLDTVIICLKKRPIIFLHVYHHCITVVLVYVMISNAVAVNWIATAANCLVHIPMYYYYGMSALGYDIWWKKYITKLQITQFVVDLSANSVGFYFYYSGYNCSGVIESWIFGQAVLVSFLILFILFYKSTYRKTGSRAVEKKSN